MNPVGVALSALLALPAVAAVGELGFNLGVQRNSDSQCKVTSDYETDFDNLASSGSNLVKVYAASDCNTLQQIGPALVSKNVELFLGVWPNDEAHFEAEQNALKQYLPTIPTSNIRGILVGSEALYRGDQTGTSLAAAINLIKDLVKDIQGSDGKSYSNVPVGTVDSWNMWVDDANIPAIQASDVIMANAFSYWQGQTQNNASYSFFDDIMQAIQHIQTAKGTEDVNFWVGETGWPTAGENYQSAVPNVDNAENFWQDGICAMRGWGVNTIIFEAYDETWKPAATAADGEDVSETERNWGVLQSNGQPKYNISCNF